MPTRRRHEAQAASQLFGGGGDIRRSSQISYDDAQQDERATESVGAQCNLEQGDIELMRHSTERNQTASPLLRLPGELRNKIYSYVFHGRSVTISLVCLRGLTTPVPKTSPSLLRVCRQIHCEASSLAIELTTFRSNNADDLREWFNELPQHQRNAVASIELRGNRTTLGSLYEHQQNRISLDDVPDWWNEDDMAWHILPELKTIHVLMCIMCWEDEGSDKDRDFRFAETGRVFQEEKEFVESVNPGVKATFEVCLRKHWWGQRNGPNGSAGIGPRRT